MLNHFLYDILINNNYFSKGHNVGTTVCPPLFSPIVDFNIAAYRENLMTEQSVPIDTMLKAHSITMAKISIK